MTIFEIVQDALWNAYSNGYKEETDAYSDEYLAYDMIDAGVFEESVNVAAVIAAIKEFRNVRDC